MKMTFFKIKIMEEINLNILDTLVLVRFISDNW